MKTFDTQWLKKDKEVSPEKYDEMLGCLPPKRMAYGGFLVGEATKYGLDLSSNFEALFELYFTEAGKYYYGGPASVSDFEAFTH